MKNYRDRVRQIIERRNEMVCCKGNNKLQISNAALPPGAGTTVSTIDSTTTTGADNGASIVASGDGDDGGDADPDSDRRKLLHSRKSPHLAPVQRAKSNRILRMPEVKVRIGLSRSTIYEAISKGEFPAPIPLGSRAVGWLEADLDAWLDWRIAASKAA